MQAKKLELKDFRNYTEQELSFTGGVNIIFGDNAQGKTNILEAIYMFSMGKANRARKDAELIRYGCDSAKAALEFSGRERESTAEINLFKNRRKVITVNDIPIRRNSELVGRFPVIYFGPEYLSLVKEGPKQRRRSIDILISQLKPRYFSALSDLKKITESKNALLKMDRPNAAMLEIINEKLSSISAEVIFYRCEYIKKAAQLAADIQLEASNGAEKLEMLYMSSIGDADGLSIAEIKAKFNKKLEEVSKREFDTRESVVGPHREDIEYLINGKSAKSFASQGQQKTIVLVQKLAEVGIIQEETGENPVLLLDDIMSELDKKRRAFILNHINDTQIIVTCTDTDGFDIPGDARLFEVENGSALQL